MELLTVHLPDAILSTVRLSAERRCVKEELGY